MPQKTDAVIAELMDRRLLNDVDPDLHQEIAKAVVKAVHTASLQGEDAVERVKVLARRFWSIHPSTIAAMNLTREEFYAREMMALLATGIVPDEAAIRADEREKQRERDAKIADEHASSYDNEWNRKLGKSNDLVEACDDIAAAIRSGGMRDEAE